MIMLIICNTYLCKVAKFDLDSCDEHIHISLNIFDFIHKQPHISL